MKLLSFLRRCNKGTAAIEFAFLAPVLLLASFGIYEFGRWAWTLEALQETATSGARCVGIGQSSCEASGTYNASSTATYVQNVALGWGLSVPAADITSTNSTTCGGISGFSQVQISYVFISVVPKFIPTGTNGTTLTVQSCYPNNG
jgi:Flp pilus assembly protein TadG